MDTVDLTKQETMLGSLWVRHMDGVLYKCVRYESDSGLYFFEGYVGPRRHKTSCLYSFVPQKFTLIAPPKG